MTGNSYINKALTIMGVLIFSLSLTFSGCGGTLGNSMVKALAEAGPYAIYFPGIDQPGFYNFINAKTKNTPLSGGEITVEAWIKIEDPVNGGGTILARGQQGFGILLDVDNNSGLARFFVDSQQVTSTAAVNDGGWHHIAGMFVGMLPVGDQHNHSTSPICTAVTGSLHLDIYVDGFFNDCAPAAYPSAGVDACTDPDGIPVACTNYIGRDLANVFGGRLFKGTIDEIRVWKEARSQGKIQKWMDKEIRGEDLFTPENNSIAGYWRLNEGTGDEVLDSSGYGNKGSKLRCTSDCGTEDEVTQQWLDGWVEGYLF